MKFVNTTLLFLLFTGLAACRSSRNSTRSDERDLSNLIARLNKKGANDKVMADISEVYNGALLRGRERISNYQFEESPFRYDGILTEMEALQRMYETIGRSAYALRQLKPVNFAPQI
ncbi:MAG TPA: hypothetical protein PKE63_13800, partial [Lacibacter sp.]|nr:hypothetical protein [Lacibacter sp.]